MSFGENKTIFRKMYRSIRILLVKYSKGGYRGGGVLFFGLGCIDGQRSVEEA